jgi:hypothetical protein
MKWLRKSSVLFLSLLLFVSLVGTALSVSTNMAFSKPDKVEKWLEESGLYESFSAYITEQSLQEAGSNQDLSSAEGNNPDIKQAVEASFPAPLLKQSVNSFLEGNYSWLRGETAQPSFVVDLSSAKQNFAEQIGKYVQGRLEKLPVCTNEQLAQIPDPASADPLTITCRPPTVNPTEVGTRITQQVAGSGDFLSQPVVTAQSINPEDPAGQREPYYEKFSQLPKAYQLGQILPIILGVLALLSALGLIFLSSWNRKGLRRVGFITLIAGIVLILSKLITDIAFNRLETRIFNNTNAGQIQHSLINFANTVQDQLARIDLYFGIAYVVLAALILIYIYSTRWTPPKSSNVNEEPLPEPGSAVKPSATSRPGANGQTNPNRPKRRPPRGLIQ